jgi:hypothetical protein
VFPTERFSALAKPKYRDAAVASLEQNAKTLGLEITRRHISKTALQQALRLLNDRPGKALSYDRSVGAWGYHSRNPKAIVVNPQVLPIVGAVRSIRNGQGMARIGLL